MGLRVIPTRVCQFEKYPIGSDDSASTWVATTVISDEERFISSLCDSPKKLIDEKILLDLNRFLEIEGFKWIVNAWGI